MPSHSNLAIIAGAGARKTEYIVEQALADPQQRVLITTYTEESQRHLLARIRQKAGGVVPPHITVMGWLTFLLGDGARPYQEGVLGDIGVVRSLQFKGERPGRPKKSDVYRYYLNSHRDIYRDYLADFVCRANEATGGSVIKRLSAVYDHIFVDEFQDLSGYDLDIIDLLLQGGPGVTVVGDPRQQIMATNRNQKNRQFKQERLATWLENRAAFCALEFRVENYRCNQEICDFADALFPDLPSTESRNSQVTDHDGIVTVERSQVHEYVAEHRPAVLRWAKNSDTLGLTAMNFGVSKGLTFDRVLIFPTESMLAYVKTRDLSKLKAKEKLYVAVTRARFSVAFVS